MLDPFGGPSKEKITNPVSAKLCAHSQLGMMMGLALADGQSSIVVDCPKPAQVERAYKVVRALHKIWQPGLPLLRLDVPESLLGANGALRALMTAYCQARDLPVKRWTRDTISLTFHRELRQAAGLLFVAGAERLTTLGFEMLRQDMCGVLGIFCGPAEIMEEAIRASETVERRMLWLEAQDLAPAKKTKNAL